MKLLSMCLVGLLWIASAPPDAGPQSRRPSTARVLFIGNSLTYVNDLPGMIEAIAAQTGARVTCRGVAKPNFGLGEHWNDGDAMRAIEAQRWTHVVLQQGPTSVEASREVLRKYTKTFWPAIRKQGSKAVLYGVWPPRARLSFLDAVTESYRLAAEDVGGSLVPVGAGWAAAWRRDPALPLYGPDDFHPSPMGTYLAALMFVEHLTGASPLGLPPPSASKARALRELKITDAELKILQEAAAEAVNSQKRAASRVLNTGG